MINSARVKRKMYFDSITLMKVARSLSVMEGVEDVSALMATPANLQLLTDAGLSPFEGVTSEPGEDDVLIVVRAHNEAQAQAALDAAEAHLRGNVQEIAPLVSTTGLVRQPRSLEEAVRQHGQAGIAVISVPGMYAALEAQQALKAGLHVFLFSDNVSLEDEIALKRQGAQQDLLVMGPDCGTARLNGVGLGFVNVVPDGTIGLVGASGTGMQQVMCLLAQSGHGISQAIGCGGRDLSEKVGGITALHGLRLLQADVHTKVIVLISKPPAPAVAKKVLAAAATAGKPVVVVFVGANPAAWQGKYGARVHIVRTLADAARLAGSLCEEKGIDVSSTDQNKLLSMNTPTPAEGQAKSVRRSQPPYLAALFSGGTLCDEALHLWGEALGPIYSNIPFNPAWNWHETSGSQGHYALDLGADEYTRGRPHPMIDPEARLKYLRAAASDPAIGVILLDIVLGYCAYPDPAAIYAPAIREGLQQAMQAGRHLNYIISLCGTEGDPQRLSRQQEQLRASGAETYLSNAEAALRCQAILTGPASEARKAK
jgi:FdrA protein